MCGINGILSQKSINHKEILLMNQKINHRGPDDEGTFKHQNILLGSRRLSIIDLQDGHQPIFNEDKTLVIVFNGEIYNYRDLRKNLIDKGHHFKTHSDTEVILHLYEEKGAACLHKLNGMFAFAIYDIRNKELFLARDRLGKKPLFYWKDQDQFVFSSELKAILHAFPLKRSISVEALELYFALTFIPAPFTIFEDIFKLEAGHYMKISADLQYDISQYWKIDGDDSESSNSLNLGNHKKKIIELLSDAVELRMISDVPLGAFLSGGIDSSIIVGLMSEISGKKIQTFTIGNKEKSYDESAKAEFVAKYFKTDHHTFIIQDDDYLSILDRAINDFDEPFADSSALPTYLVSEFARQQVKVILTGDGGDEVFAGYNRYLVFKYLEKYMLLPLIVRNYIIRPIFNNLPVSSKYRKFVKVKKIVNNEGKNIFDQYHAMQRLGFSERDLADILLDNNKSDYTRSFVYEKYNMINYASNLNKILQTDLTIGLEGDMLVKVDRMSMLNSLEARCPFLDYRLVEYSFKIPAELKLYHGQLKYLLKECFREKIPPGILAAPKQGFEIPIGNFISNQLQPKIQNFLKSDLLNTLRLVDLNKITKINQKHLLGIDKSFQLWTFFVFANWVENFQNFIEIK